MVLVVLITFVSFNLLFTQNVQNSQVIQLHMTFGDQVSVTVIRASNRTALINMTTTNTTRMAYGNEIASESSLVCRDNSNYPYLLGIVATCGMERGLVKTSGS